MVTCYGNVKGKHLDFETGTNAKSRYDVAIVGAHVTCCLVVIAKSDVEVVAEQVFGTKDEVTEEVFKKVIVYDYTAIVGCGSGVGYLPTPQVVCSDRYAYRCVFDNLAVTKLQVHW